MKLYQACPEIALFLGKLWCSSVVHASLAVRVLLWYLLPTSSAALLSSGDTMRAASGDDGMPSQSLRVRDGVGATKPADSTAESGKVSPTSVLDARNTICRGGSMGGKVSPPSTSPAGTRQASPDQGNGAAPATVLINQLLPPASCPSFGFVASCSPVGLRAHLSSILQRLPAEYPLLFEILLRMIASMWRLSALRAQAWVNSRERPICCTGAGRDGQR